MKESIKKKTWVVTYGGYVIYDGEDAEVAYEKYLIGGPYSKIYEDGGE